VRLFFFPLRIPCIAAYVAVFLLCGCGANVNIRSNPKPDFHPKIERVFVAIRPTEDAAPVCKAMGVHFNTLLAKNGFDVQVVVNNSLALDEEEDYLPEMKAFHPDLALVIQPEGRVSLNYGKFSAVAFDSSLTTPVWKASVEGDFIGNGYGAIWGLIGEKLTEAILRRLDEDHILPLRHKPVEPVKATHAPASSTSPF